MERDMYAMYTMYCDVFFRTCNFDEKLRKQGTCNTNTYTCYDTIIIHIIMIQGIT